MASESSSLSQSSLTNKHDQFDGLEVTEFDANALWELLSNGPGGEEIECGGGANIEATESIGPKHDPVVESYWPLDDINNDNVQGFKWFNIMEEGYTACSDDMGVEWYGGQCMEEMHEIFALGDYSLSHNAILSDEIGYIQLWQHN